ncbi:MAG: nitrogen regulation protein NR(II) [Alphaproteobacteria bacterium]
MRPDLAAILNALPDTVLLVDEGNRIRYANGAAEQLLQASVDSLVGQDLRQILSAAHPLLGLIHQVREGGYSLTEYGVSLESPRFAVAGATVHAGPVADGAGGFVLLTIHQPSIAQKIDQQLVHRNAARSVAGMAAVLAHEVKNPLAGIRGAAQLVEQNCDDGDRELTQLICDEADRICALVDRMDIFAEQRPLVRGPVNIHEVLDRVRRSASSGVARHVRFTEQYDPSLPPVLGDRDQLVQVFLNLVKNAAEAVPEEGGEIVISTAYRHGVRLAVRSTGERVGLPLMVTVQDNGSGIPEDLGQHLFDPFVTTKAGGHGLGLALVAKIVDEHGGVIEFESEPRRTAFRVMLPMCASEESSSDV